MRSPALTIGGLMCLAVAPGLSAAQDERDFVFTDEDGHRVLRFAGSEPGGLDPDQFDEIVNVEFSTMVHDRLRADLRFESEPVDPEWAESMKTRLETHLSGIGPEFSTVEVECRSASCRLVLEHAVRWRLPEHRSRMGAVQRVIHDFIRADPDSFEPVFLITAYDQELETPHIMAFLRRMGRD